VAAPEPPAVLIPPAPTVAPPRHLRARVFLASTFGLGLSPVLPGTCAALLGFAWHGLWAAYGPPELLAAGLGAGLVLAGGLNHVLTPFAVRHWGTADPAQFAWDEVAGYLLAALLTCGLPWWPAATLAFVLFRALDMLKVWPASWIDRRLHGPWGILLDDLVSAVFAAGLVHAVAWSGWIPA
jgi:phosphatidylglycerophosphatase A